MFRAIPSQTFCLCPSLSMSITRTQLKLLMTHAGALQCEGDHKPKSVRTDYTCCWSRLLASSPDPAVVGNRWRPLGNCHTYVALGLCLSHLTRSRRLAVTTVHRLFCPRSQACLLEEIYMQLWSPPTKGQGFACRDMQQRHNLVCYTFVVITRRKDSLRQGTCKSMEHEDIAKFCWTNKVESTYVASRYMSAFDLITGDEWLDFFWVKMKQFCGTTLMTWMFVLTLWCWLTKVCPRWFRFNFAMCGVFAKPSPWRHLLWKMGLSWFSAHYQRPSNVPPL